MNAANLGLLPPEVQVPTYDRSGLSAGIVHFGVGGFHRAHQALAIDRLLEAGEAQEWAICGVGVLPSDAAMRDVLRAQDFLYTVVERHADGTARARVVGSIIDYLFAPDDPERVIEKLAAPETRIVSLTITEGGYNTNFVSGDFDLAHPAVAADLGAADPSSLQTPFGLVVEALRRRRERGVVPFTILSCDNIQDNGHVARNAFLAYAEALDADLAAWIAERVPFPSTMVDRITPATTPEDREFVSAELGIVDAWPVICEPFFQWVVEDRFVDGRPPLEHADVQFTQDVAPYELMKLRLLNVSYVGIAHIGYLRGYRLAYESAEDPLVVAFVLRYMEEVSPTLRPVPGVDLDEYTQTLIARFSNKYVRDTIGRLAMEASDRLPKWLLPAVRELLEKRLPVAYSAAIIAAWARYAEGVDEDGNGFEVVDRCAAKLVAAAGRQRSEPLAFLEDRELFGDILDHAAFTEPYAAVLESLHRGGAAATLQSLGG